MMQVVPSSGQAVQRENLTQHSGYGVPVTTTSSLPPPPSYSTYIAGKKTNSEKVSEEDVQSIQKKIGDAFTQSSEEMLLSAFEEALKKFQDNDKAYKRSSVGGGSELAPGTSGTKTQAAVPKPLPESIRIMPTTSQSQQQKQHHYHPYLQVAATPPNMSAPQQQQQLLLQQIPGDYANLYTIPAVSGAGNQVRVAGLYYPNMDQSEPHKVIMASKKVASPTKPQTLLQRVIVPDRPRLSGHHQGVSSRPQQQVTKGTHPAQRTTTTTGSSGTRHSNKMKCAWCGGGAIYLCSGCQAEWYCGNECQVCWRGDL